MHPGLEYVVTSATARKGNHPVLWLLFGGIALCGAVTGILDGRVNVSIGGLIGCFWGHPSFREVTFATEPVLFMTSVIGMIFFACYCLLIGSLAIWLRHDPRKPKHRWAGVVQRENRPCNGRGIAV